MLLAPGALLHLVGIHRQDREANEDESREKEQLHRRIGGVRAVSAQVSCSSHGPARTDGWMYAESGRAVSGTATVSPPHGDSDDGRTSALCEGQAVTDGREGDWQCSTITFPLNKFAIDPSHRSEAHFETSARRTG